MILTEQSQVRPTAAAACIYT